MKKVLKSALLAMSAAAMISITSYAGWYQNDAGTWYYYDEASEQNLTDFQYIDGKWYFFCTREDETKGAMLTGEQWIAGRCFYMDPDDGGAVAFDTDFNGYHFGTNGYAVANNGNDITRGNWTIDSRLKTNKSLLTKIPKINPYTEPDVTDNAEFLGVVRNNLGTSLWGKALSIHSDEIPEGKVIANRNLKLLYQILSLSNDLSHTTDNVVYKLAGKEIPYPNEWGENCQFMYDWMVEFYKSHDWEHASDYDKAYHLYCYLGEHFGYGSIDSMTGKSTDFDGPSTVTWQLGSQSLASRDFTEVYLMLGTSMGLDVGTSGIDGDRLRTFNIIRIDGELYVADAASYARYGKRNSYFGKFKKAAFYEESTTPSLYEEGELYCYPSEVVY